MALKNGTRTSRAKTRSTLLRHELASSAGVNPETLRFYEKVGLIPKPVRSANGYRQYPAAMVQRIQFIQAVKDLGFTLKEIQALLSLRAQNAVTCRTSAGVAAKKLEELDAKIEALQGVRHKLARFMKRCQKQPEGQNCETFSLLDG